MKAYVYDNDWAGAEVYFSESREKAVKHFQEKELENVNRMINQHNVEKSGPIPDCWFHNLKLYSDIKYVDYKVLEYVIEEGSTFFTNGEY